MLGSECARHHCVCHSGALKIPNLQSSSPYAVFPKSRLGGAEPTGSEPVLYPISAHLLFHSVAHSAELPELPRPNIGPLSSNNLDDHILGSNGRPNFRGQGKHASLWAENSNTATKVVPSCKPGSTLTFGDDSPPSRIRTLSPVQPLRKFFRGIAVT